jgi:hypothetical protein
MGRKQRVAYLKKSRGRDNIKIRNLREENLKGLPSIERCRPLSHRSLSSPEFNPLCWGISFFTSDFEPLRSESTLDQLGANPLRGEERGLLDSLYDPKLGADGRRPGLLSRMDDAVEGLDGL